MMLKQGNVANGKSIFDVKPKGKDRQMVIDQSLEVPATTNALGKNASSPCTSIRKKIQSYANAASTKNGLEAIELKKELCDFKSDSTTTKTQ